MAIPAGVREIGAYAFAYCDALASVSLPEGLERIGNRAFLECLSLTQVTLPDGLKVLEDGVFLSSGLTSQPAWPSGLEEVGDSIYKMCEGITGTGTLPGGALGDSASTTFDDSNISKAVVSDGVTYIPSQAFSSCSKLAFVYIPASVTAIDNLAFYGSNRIAHIYYEGSQEDWDNITIGSSSSACLKRATLHCLGFNHPPTGERPVYESTTVKRTIRIFDPDNRAYPVPTGFTVEVNGTAYSTGGKNYITLELDRENPPDVTISKEGYRTYTLPGEQIGASNLVYLYRANREGPIPQAILLDKSSGSYLCYANLMQESELITLSSARWKARTLYLSVDWNGCGEGRAYLCQSTGWQVELTEGYNQAVCLNQGLKTGIPIYLKLVGADGTVTEQALKLSVQSGTQPTVRLNLGSSETEAIIRDPAGSKVDVVDNQSLGVDFKKVMGSYLPISFELKEDGTLKGTIGLKLQEEQEYEGFDKETYDALNNALAAMNSGAGGAEVDALIQKAVKLGLLNEDVKIKVGISGSVQVLGTFEGCLDEEGWPKISSAKLALLFSGGVSYTQNYLIGTVPMYFTASLQASLESAIQACMNDQGQLEPQDISQPGVYSMAFTLGITVENGVGNPQILSGGVQGSGNLKVQFNLPYDSNHTAWSLNASAAFVGSLLGYASGSWVFWNSKELILYQDGQLLPDSGVATLAALDLADVEWVQAGRDYLDKPSAFTANDSLSLLVEEDGQLASAVLQSNVYPYTVPRIAVYSYREGSERTAAVWLQDVTGRSDENRTALYYSTYNGYYWDAPQMVPTGSQTADFAPTLQVVDNQTVALWMKADTVLESGIDVEETASHMEIAYGALGSGTYRTIGLEGLDMLPVLWKDGQGIQIAFVHCPDGLFGEEMEIWRYTEATGEYTLLAEGLSGVDALAVDDGGTLYYSVSREGAQSLYRLTASGGSQRMGDGGKPVWACDRLWWYDGGMVRSTAGDAVPTLAGSDWFLPLEFGGRQAVLFRGGREDGGTILSLSLKDGDWQQPIPLLETEEYLSDVSASASAQTGKLAILANRQTMGEGYEITQADLVYWQVTPDMDLAVTAAAYDGTTLIPGEALRVSLQVANRGTEAASLFQVDLYDGETLVSTAYAKEELPSGGSILLTADLPLPETLPGSVTLQVTPLMADEVSPEDNRIPLELRLADVSVEEIAAQTAGDGTVETVVRVVNRGQNTLTDLPVSLHGGAEDGPEAAERQTITSLAPGDVAVLSFVSAAGALEEGGLVYAVVQLTQEQQAVENLLANNTGFAMVQSGVTEADTRFRVYAGTAAENGRASVVVSVENNSGEAVAASYYIALYQSDGRMVEATTTGLITVEAGERRTAAELTVPYARGLTAKVFVLDGDSRPLLPAWSGAVGEAEDT